MDIFVHLNELSIVVAALLAVAIGTIWYSPMFFDLPSNRTNNNDHISSKSFVQETVVHVLGFIVFFSLIGYMAVKLQLSEIPFLTIVLLIVAISAVYTLLLGLRERQRYTNEAQRSAHPRPRRFRKT